MKKLLKIVSVIIIATSQMSANVGNVGKLYIGMQFYGSALKINADKLQNAIVPNATYSIKGATNTTPASGAAAVTGKTVPLATNISNNYHAPWGLGANACWLIPVYNKFSLGIMTAVDFFFRATTKTCTLYNTHYQDYSIPASKAIGENPTHIKTVTGALTSNSKSVSIYGKGINYTSSLQVRGYAMAMHNSGAHIFLGVHWQSMQASYDENGEDVKNTAFANNFFAVAIGIGAISTIHKNVSVFGRAGYALQIAGQKIAFGKTPKFTTNSSVINTTFHDVSTATNHAPAAEAIAAADYIAHEYISAGTTSIGDKNISRNGLIFECGISLVF